MNEVREILTNYFKQNTDVKSTILTNLYDILKNDTDLNSFVVLDKYVGGHYLNLKFLNPHNGIIGICVMDPSIFKNTDSIQHIMEIGLINTKNNFCFVNEWCYDSIIKFYSLKNVILEIYRILMCYILSKYKVLNVK